MTTTSNKPNRPEKNSESPKDTHLWSLEGIVGRPAIAQDGEVGSVEDVLVDGLAWDLRYFVVNTGNWLAGKRVLVAPPIVHRFIPESRELAVSTTREKVESGPSIDDDRPVSRQREIEFAQHFAWPARSLTPTSMPTPLVPPPIPPNDPSPGADTDHDPDLRSLQEITGYAIHALDGSIGKLHDLVADESSWRCRYLVVDTGEWLPGRRVLVSPSWISEVSWKQRTVRIDLPKKSIESSPEFDPNRPVNRAYEERLYDFYGRAAYWNE